MPDPTPSTPAAPVAPAPSASTPTPTPTPTPAPSGDQSAPAPGQTPVTPEPEYKLTLPDGSPLEATAVERLTAFAKDGKLAPDTAQKALDLVHQETAALIQRQTTEYKQKVEGWETSLKADKELGGANLTRTLTRVKTVMDKYGNPELTKALQDTGFGNYPALVRLVEQIGAAMEGDKPLPPTTPAPEPDHSLDRMFPKSAEYARTLR